MTGLERTSVFVLVTIVSLGCYGQTSKSAKQKATDFVTGQAISTGTKEIVGTVLGAGAIAGGVAGGMLAPNTSIPDSAQEAEMNRQLKEENMKKYGKPYYDPPQDN